MINTAAFLDAFEPVLEAGDDILIHRDVLGPERDVFSGGRTAADILKKKSTRSAMSTAVDTHSATIVQGILVLEAADLRRRGPEPGGDRGAHRMAQGGDQAVLHGWTI
jgi:fatty acid-binding protein DegV